MKKNYEKLPYEFLLLINNKPIVGRNFSIRGFNIESVRSLELKEIMDDVVDILKSQFKEKSADYLYKYYNPYITQTEADVMERTSKINLYENEDMFTFQIKINGKIVAESIFSGNDFPPRVRYDVDIRKNIPEIICYNTKGDDFKKLY